MASTRYPRVARDAQGTWVPADDALIYVTGNLWTFYGAKDGLPADRVREVAPDEREVWAATPRGLGRMDRNSRRWERFGAPDPLPSDDVLGVAVDDRTVWVATARGAVRYDKQTRTWSPVADPQGPGERPVADVLSQGGAVWFAAADGVYRLDRQTEVWRRFGAAEGLLVGEVGELLSIGESLWILGARGLGRLDLRTLAVSLLTEREGLPSPQISAFAQVEGEMWIGTDRGLVVYSASSDALTPFLYAEGMPPGPVTGIFPSVPYVWVSTEGGLGLFNTHYRTWEEKREADGLASSRIEGMAADGASLILLQPDGYQAYETQADEWRSYRLDDVWSGAMGDPGAEASRVRWNVELQVDGEGALVDNAPGARHSAGEGFDEYSGRLVPDLRVGVGTVLQSGRTLDASARVDAGDLIQSDALQSDSDDKEYDRNVREYDVEVRLKGAEDDWLRELILSDELPLRGQEDEHDLLDDAWLEGAGVYLGTGREPGREREGVSFEAEAGVRRGVRFREFFRGSIDFVYPLARQYLTPASEVVKVDGQILERDIDYIVNYTTGSLTFLNPDAVNALSLVEISYTYEQVPRKGSASLSILEMLPRDNELGGYRRAGSPAYVTDDTGLFRKIDGAAPKYIDRGWVESVFQDYTQGATSLSLAIHDMGTPQNAMEILDYDRPISYRLLWDESEVEDSLALLDESLPAGYAVKMRFGRYYVELTIDEKSRAAENLAISFAQAVRVRGDLEASLIDSLRAVTGRMHAGFSPADSGGLGAGLLGSRDLEDEDVIDRHGLEPEGRVLAFADGWTRHRLGDGPLGGTLSSFFQAGRSRTDAGPGGVRQGQALSGNVAYRSESLNLRLDGEAHSREFDTLGTRRTALGTLESDLRADGTLQPARWLRLRMLYDRESSYLDPAVSPSGQGRGLNENLAGKLTFIKAKWPTIWLLGGRSVLAADGQKDEKLRFAGSLEYDLARGVLEGLGLKKLALKAYFDHSQNELNGVIPPSEEASQLAPEEDPWQRVSNLAGTAQNMRLELKAAPTATEDGYVRFERKTFDPDAREDQAEGLQPLEGWELLMGAASRYLPGVVPTFNGKISFREGGLDEGGATQEAASLLAGQLELFPGRWIEALGSTILAVGYGYTQGEESEQQPFVERWDKTLQLNKHQVEVRGSYGRYDDVFRAESRGKWWLTLEGPPGEDGALVEGERYVEVLNRFTYRPIYTSPISLRLDVRDLRTLEGEPEPERGEAVEVLPSLEWERRWSHDLVTKLRVEAPYGTRDNVWDEARAVHISYEEVGVKPWAELRLRLKDLWLGSVLRLTLRAHYLPGWQRWPEQGEQDDPAWRSDLTGLPDLRDRGWLLAGHEVQTACWLDWERAGSFIVRLGATYTYLRGLDGDRDWTETHSLQPMIKALVRL